MTVDEKNIKFHKYDQTPTQLYTARIYLHVNIGAENIGNLLSYRCFISTKLGVRLRKCVIHTARRMDFQIFVLHLDENDNSDDIAIKAKLLYG